MPALPSAQAAPPRLPELPHLSRPGSGAAPLGSSVTGDPPRSEFGGETARCYARYRRDYPEELLVHLASLPRERKLLVDLGCGTGQLALQLASSFEHCVGVDPEPAMLAEARRLARERGISNVDWVEGAADDLPGLEGADLLTIGTAFHFMEPVTTLERISRVVGDGGAVAVAYNGSPMWLHPDEWARSLRVVLEERFGPLRDVDIAVEGIQAAEDAMRELGFRDVDRWEELYEDEIDREFVVGHIFSALSSDQIEAQGGARLADEIRASLPEGRFIERVRVRAVSGRP